MQRALWGRSRIQTIWWGVSARVRTQVDPAAASPIRNRSLFVIRALP
jgi:hypothetical protein